MQTWARRGVQTALVTGGLLMLGTGIASADEQGNPDKPAGPVDINVAIPIDISKNAIGTLGKQIDLPGVQQEISIAPVTATVNKVLAPLAGTGVVEAASPVTGAVNGVAANVAQRTDPAVESDGDPLAGNKAAANLAVPIQITGNALGVLGDASVDSDSTQTYAHNTDVYTDGAGGGLAGNAVDLDWALPVQISGNALELGGRGKTSGSATQSAATTGDIATDGANGLLAGNVVSPQGATPVQVSGNAVGGLLGHAESDFDGSGQADSGGWTATHGSGGAVTGSVADAPLALPVKISNNAASWGGDAHVTGGSSSAGATAGDTTPGFNGVPSYIQTDADDSLLAGTVVQPQAAVPGSVVGNAGALIGNSVSHDSITSASDASAGGYSSTTGRDSAASGNVVDLPAALPAELVGSGGSLIGDARAEGTDNAVAAVAGDSTYTNGDGGLLAGNSASVQPAGTAEVFGAAGALIGNASGSATECKDVHAGGYNGSLGNDSAGSGNVVQVPVSLPAELFGAGASLIGQSTGTASETKTVQAGGGGSTQDDHGAISSNLAQLPLSAPIQAFGLGGALIGQSSGTASSNTTSSAGGTGEANGKEGFVAGNIGALPASLPVQLHGDGAALIGNGFGESQGVTGSTAGGDLTATGEGGSIAGNVVAVPTAGAGQVFGVGAVLAGLAGGDATNDVVSTAGGDTETNGDNGSIAGNVVSAPLLPVAQVFGDAVSVIGIAHGAAVNNTEAHSGGDITTSGEGGSISGDILDVPVAALAQVFGVAASLGGHAHAVADNTTTGSTGGADTTSGPDEALSGLTGQLPVGVVVQVFDIPLAVLADAVSITTNTTDVSVAGQEPDIDLPIIISELPATGLPALPFLPGSLR